VSRSVGTQHHEIHRVVLQIEDSLWRQTLEQNFAIASRGGWDHPERNASIRGYSLDRKEQPAIEIGGNLVGR
jgi:hypothetical protein